MSDDPQDTLGARLRALREKRGVSVTMLVVKLVNLGVHATATGIYKVERGDHKPRPELIAGIAVALDAKDSELPEVAVARAQLALDEGDWDAALVDLKSALRARRLAEPDGHGAAARAARRIGKREQPKHEGPGQRRAQ